MSIRFLKGHGTENDFVLLPDPDGTEHGDLDAALVAALCDRRAGIGADGVMRVVRCASYDDPAAVAARDEAEWFMDYRNSDGSLSEMCGNGVRVFARYLLDHEGATSPLKIGTRAGVKTLTLTDDGRLTVDMGAPVVVGETKVGVGERSWPATHVSMGNPHAVAFVDSLDEAGPLLDPPAHEPADFPAGRQRGVRRPAWRASRRDAGARARLRRDPLLRHRRVRGDGRRGARRRGRTRHDVRRRRPRRDARGDLDRRRPGAADRTRGAGRGRLLARGALRLHATLGGI